MQELINPTNTEVAKRSQKEERLIRELTDPRVYACWTATGRQLAEFHDFIIRFLKPEWIVAATPIFSEAGLNINNFTAADLENLSRQDPGKYAILKEGLIKLNQVKTTKDIK